MRLAALALSLALAAPADRGEVQFRVDGAQRRPISRFIYGLNDPGYEAGWGKRLPPFTIARFGGNRWTAYNWETNASNCGNDCGDKFQNDGYLGGGEVPGEAVRRRVEAVSRSPSAGSASRSRSPRRGCRSRPGRT